MALIVPEESQRPYRFGMTLVCIGALFNWLGLADHHTKPVPAVRYIGVGLVASGAVLICMAMCFWMNSVRDDDDDESVDHVHVISLDPPVRLDEKPPDYATVVDVPPPSYDDAIKLDPHRLLVTTAPTGNCSCGGELRRVAPVSCAAADTCAITVPDECDKSSSDACRGTVASCDVAGPTIASQHQQQQQQQQHQQQHQQQLQQQQQQQSSTTTLAQAIRKSIRDIRKQLTNTVSDSTTDVEQQQQQQQQQPQQHQYQQPQQPEQQQQRQHHLLQRQCGPPELAAAVRKSTAQTANDPPTSH